MCEVLAVNILIMTYPGIDIKEVKGEKNGEG